VFVRRPGPLSWASFRDVFEVDGAPVHDRDARLEKLFRPDPGNATDRVRQIAQESARFNLGSATRTLNIPTLPLLFLNPANQARFSYKKVGEGRQSGMATIEVRCQEVARPTLFRDSGTIGDLPVEGRFWIDPIHGIVLRSVIRFTFARDRGDGSVTTQYRYEAGLRLWVPSEMQERYEDRHVAGASEIRGSTTAIARYSNFRQFTVSTEEKAALPPESPEP